ncbi:hypothetical protein [Micromonospora sp. NPDC092111]|uniref:hypothetical protein n=1 Tax=Micromonospora sp. NPDC092111 TaxID=3364289 RepID=UPI00380456A2
MRSTGAAAGFHTELRRLYQAAGSPSQAEVIRKASRQGLRLNSTTLSDWLAGKSVPSKGEPVEFLVNLLHPAAIANGYASHSIDWWKKRRQEAWEESRANRGGRPPGERRPLQQTTLTATGIGDLVGELDEEYALKLEVHRSITTGDLGSRGEVLPRYLRRTHDDRLESELLWRAERGGLVVLIGESTSGKTRSCWEAIRKTLPEWRIWHPRSPTRPEAILEALSSGAITPNTIIWLNELQLYFPRGLGRQVASALQEIVSAPARGPVIALGTIWKKEWDALLDSDAEVRHLLQSSSEIDVPMKFGTRELSEQEDLLRSDPRLILAHAKAHGGKITQFLAGSFELLRRFERGGEEVKAIACAAIDARRLGHGTLLSEEFLRSAAPGYMDKETWDRVGEEWFEDSMSYLTEPWRGVLGVLRRHGPKNRGTPKLYRLADYVDQVGRDARRYFFPPPSFWKAALHCHPDDMIALARAAKSRYRYKLERDLTRAALERLAVDTQTKMLDLRVAAAERAADLPPYKQGLCLTGPPEGFTSFIAACTAWARPSDDGQAYRRPTKAINGCVLVEAHALWALGKRDLAIGLYLQAANTEQRGVLSAWAQELFNDGHLDQAKQLRRYGLDIDGACEHPWNDI